MLDTFTASTFSPHLGETFQIEPEGAAPLMTELIEARELGGQARAASGDSGRAPFSLVFRGPLDMFLPQRIYRITHDAIGTVELFLVPIGPDEKGMRYEAVFT